MDRIPILQMGNFLLVTIQVDLHDQLALELQNDLTEKILKTSAKGVLIDISALEVVDSFMGRMLVSIASMCKLLDANTVVTGIQPAVAITLVELGLSLQGVITALNVNRGVKILERLVDRFPSTLTLKQGSSREHTRRKYTQKPNLSHSG